MVLSADVSTLALARQELPDSNDHMILPEMATKQPVGPAVRQGDEEWFGIVRWTVYALVAAEELGISAATVDAARNSHSAEVRRFLGIDADLGALLGPERRLGAADHPPGRQLRRAVRPPPRAEIDAEAGAAAQQPLEPTAACTTRLPSAEGSAHCELSGHHHFDVCHVAGFHG